MNLNVSAEDKLNVSDMVISVFDRIENIVGKGENAGFQHFIFFSTMFFEAYYLGSLIPGIEGGKKIK